MYAIEVENLTKIFYFYDTPIARLQATLLPSLKKKYSRDFYALNNVSFKVPRGQTLGVIGKNGSGKSTLLKILSSLIQPSSGVFRVNGRISALLDLGGGLHPEFTGIENIFYNSSLLGYSDKDIENKLDSIIQFADIGYFINEPVKTYSSGMAVRLAFAIASNVESDILIIDEVLAVGDAQFTFKCINRLKKLIETGVTVLFVTHDISSVRSFCQSAIWIHEGRVNQIGNPLKVTTAYIQFLFEGDRQAESNQNHSVSDSTDKLIESDSECNPQVEINVKQSASTQSHFISLDSPEYHRWGSGELRFTGFSLTNQLGELVDVCQWGDVLSVKMTAQATLSVESINIGFSFGFRNVKGLDIIVATTYEEGIQCGPLKKGEFVHIDFTLDNILAPGDYLLTLAAENRDNPVIEYYDYIENAKIFKVFSNSVIYSTVKPQNMIIHLTKGNHHE
jgi:lipopolysaccharide transport system ATP-binding protein